MTETIPAAVEQRTNPYVGPRPLHVGERLDGRHRELDKLRDAVVADRVVLLYSPSGAGKSSLLEAGLRPALEAKGFFVAPTIRLNQDAPGNRYAVSAMLTLDEVQPADRRIGRDALAAMSLAEYVARVNVASQYPEGEICLIFDQFEEVFTLDPVDVAEKAAFFEQLGELLHDRGVWAVIAMREDYIAHLDPYLRVFPRRLATRLRLDFLDERSALAAVRTPARASGVEFTDEAAHRLVSDLRTVMVTRAGVPTPEQGQHVEPVQLQVVCRQLWSRLPAGTTTVTNEDVEQFADTDNALAQFYADQVAAVAATTGGSERIIRDWFEERLITPHGFRAQTFDFPGECRLDVLAGLEDAYLIRAESRRGVKWYELTHDRMIAPVKENNAEWRDARLSPLQKRAAEWDVNQRPTGLLVGGDVLTGAEAWIAHSPDSSEVEREFVAVSRTHEDAAKAELQRQVDETKRARRRSLIFALLAAIAVAGLIAATFATLGQRRAAERAEGASLEAERLAGEAVEAKTEAVEAAERAEEFRREAEARDLAARSIAADGAYDAALLALEAEFWTAAPALQSRIAWRDAVERMGRQPMLRSVGPIRTGRGFTWAVAWSPDGMTVAAGNDDGTMQLFDAATGAPVGDAVVTGHGSTLAVAWSPDGATVAAGNDDGTMQLFDAATGVPNGDPVVTGDGSTWAVAWSPDGELVATGNSDRTMRLFDATGVPVGGAIDTGDNETRSVAWSPDGTTVAAGNADGTMRLFDAATGVPVGDPIRVGDRATRSVAWSPDGTLIAAGNAGVRLFDAATATPVGDPIVTGHGSTRSVAWRPDGTVVAVANDDGTMQLIDAVTRVPLGDAIDTGSSSALAVAWSPEGTRVATGNADGTTQLFDAAPAMRGSDHIATGDGSALAVAWSPDGRVIAAGNSDGTMRLYDAATGASVTDPVETGESSTRAVAWSPDGTMVAAGNADGTLRLFDTATGRLLRDSMETGDGATRTVTWNPEGTIVATGNADGTLRLFDATTGNQIGDPIDTGDDVARSVAWSPDGTVIAAANSAVTLFDATTGILIGDPIDTVGDATWTVAWSPDGTVIGAGNSDGTMQLFDAATRAPIGGPVDTGVGSTVAVAWNPDGTVIVTGNTDGPIRLFDPATGVPIGDPIGTGGSFLRAVAWSPDGRAVATGNDDGTMKVFSSWSETEACAYLRTVTTVDDMDDLIGIDGAQSTCAHEQVDDLPSFPVLAHPLPSATSE